MDLRGDGVGIAAVSVGSIGISWVVGTIGSILIPYPCTSPKNCKTFESDVTQYSIIEIQNIFYLNMVYVTSQ